MHSADTDREDGSIRLHQVSDSSLHQVSDPTLHQDSSLQQEASLHHDGALHQDQDGALHQDAVLLESSLVSSSAAPLHVPDDTDSVQSVPQAVGDGTDMPAMSSDVGQLGPHVVNESANFEAEADDGSGGDVGGVGGGGDGEGGGGGDGGGDGEPSSRSDRSSRGRGCRCERSRCLKQYCPCFRYDLRCTRECSCAECRNDGQHEEERISAVESVLLRPKSTTTLKTLDVLTPEGTVQARRHDVARARTQARSNADTNASRAAAPPGRVYAKDNRARRVRAGQRALARARAPASNSPHLYVLAHLPPRAGHLRACVRA